MRNNGKLATACVAAGLLSGLAARAQSLPNLFPFPNATGLLETFNVGSGPIDLSGPFFQSLGTNGRSCATCHRASDGWSLSASGAQRVFLRTQGTDPLFASVDGTNCDQNIDTSTVQGRRAASSLLLNKGLFRIAIAVPANAEFTVVNVVNPYGCGDPATLSMYRRPLPATNLDALSAVMWDGRESSVQTSTQPITPGSYSVALMADLEHQALDATNGHAQASTPLTPQQQQEIAAFEAALATAQAFDYQAGPLNRKGATGGPVVLGTQTLPSFFPGINDPLGGNPHGTAFTPVIFNLFDAWANSSSKGTNDGAEGGRDSSQRASIARGQAVFNSKPINITGVIGLNDALNVASIPGTCGTCHDAPNVGNHSLAVALNIGTTDPSGPLDASYLPVFTLQNTKTGEVKVTTDPGRALVTGLWNDVGKVKGPILRGLASRAPYFHNGAADTLEEVLDFYDQRFNIGFTPQEKADLIAFLSAL